MDYTLPVNSIWDSSFALVPYGIYWQCIIHIRNECKAMVDNYPKPRYKKFDTHTEALQFVNGFDLPGSNDKSKTNQSNSSPLKKNFSNTTPQKKNYSNTSTVNRPSAASSSSGSNGDDVDLQIASCKVEMLKEQLAIAKRQKNLLEKEKKLQQLEQLGNTGKQTTKKFTATRESPYKRPEAASSWNWKNNRSTKLIDSVGIRSLHTDETNTEDGTSAVVYTDGACTNNGADGATAGIGIYWGAEHPYNTSERLDGKQTNNRAEILAVVRAVEQAKEQGIRDLTIKTDSTHVINAMTSWIKNWKKNNWMTYNKTPVKNKEEFQALDRVTQGITVHYVHVKGHGGNIGNEWADRLAVAGTKKPI